MIKLQSSRTYSTTFSPWITSFICPVCSSTNQFMNASRAVCYQCNTPMPYMEQVMFHVKQRLFYHTGRLLNSTNF